MPMRDRRPRPSAPRHPAMQANYLGAGASLQRARIEIELAVEPRLAPAQNVEAVLLGRVPGPFDKLSNRIAGQAGSLRHGLS